MEATVAKVRDFTRRQLQGERVWRVGVTLSEDSAKVTLHTPDKPERLTSSRSKNREAVAERLTKELKNHFGRDIAVEVVQAPTAVASFIRISPRKCRFVVDVIRGKSVEDALAILQFVPNSAAKTVHKLIRSAVANAENNHRMDGDLLEVMHVHVDEGPTLKRISQRAQGRAYHILKRTSHITVGLAESEKLAAKPKAGRSKSVARTVTKTTRRTGTRTEGSKKPRSTEAASPAATAAKGEQPKPTRRQRKGGE